MKDKSNINAKSGKHKQMIKAVMQSVLISAACAGSVLPAHAGQAFYNDAPTGWMNYDWSAPIKENTPKDSLPASKPTEQSPLSPSQQMKAFQTYFNNVKDLAVMNPTIPNIERYMALQHYIQNKSVQFTATWQKALLEAPEFDYNLRHPTDSLASQVDQKLKHQEEIEAVKAAAEQYGLLFFYKGEDPYAQTMAASVQSFASEYGIALIGVSVDGYSIPAINDNRPDNGQAKRLGVQALPALFLVSPKTGQYEPLAYGFKSQDQLLEQFYQIATDFSGANTMTGATNAIQ